MMPVHNNIKVISGKKTQRRRKWFLCSR